MIPGITPELSMCKTWVSFSFENKGKKRLVGLEGRVIGWSSSRVAMKTPGAKSSWDADGNEDVHEKEVPKDTFRYTWFLPP